MNHTLLLDTDVLIDYLRGLDAARRFVDGQHQRLLISTVSVAELYAGVKGEREEKQLADFVDSFEPLAVDLAIARQGGLFRNQYASSHGIGLADALLAASALAHGADLATLNQRHFPMLADIVVPYTKP